VGVVIISFLCFGILIALHVLALVHVIVCLRRLRREIGFLRVTTLETLLAELKTRRPRPGA
jgi:hypothetical protein